MKHLKAEWILVAMGLLLVAGMLLFELLQSPDLSVEQMQTLPDEVQTETTLQSRYAVNINEATVEELMGVKNITQSTAENIVHYRKEHGRFLNMNELLKVNGIGEVLLEKIRPYLTLE